MIGRIRDRLLAARIKREAEHREKMARLEQAERRLADLQQRKETALGILSARDIRNHWRESIQIMVQGGPS